MQGWLVVNGFLNSAKFLEIYHWLVDAAKMKNIQLKLLTNDQLLVRYDCHGTDVLVMEQQEESSFCENFEKSENVGKNEGFGKSERCTVLSAGYSLRSAEHKPDFVVFWDKDIPLAKALEELRIPLFNGASSIAACDDKGLTHQILAQSGIPMPVTIPIPMTYSGIGYHRFPFLNQIEQALSYPFVLKECFGSFGAQVYLINHRQEAEEWLMRLAGKPLLAQEYISTSTGRDVRVQVVGGQVVTAMLRYNDKDFRANITNGGSMKAYSPTPEQRVLAIRACALLHLDFAGVDLLFGENRQPVLCEVNSNAHFKNIYDCTGVNVADAIMEYITKQLEP